MIQIIDFIESGKNSFLYNHLIIYMWDVLDNFRVEYPDDCYDGYLNDLSEYYILYEDIISKYILEKNDI